MSSLPTKQDFLNSLSIEKCPICKEPLKNPIKTACNHCFCLDCIKPWLDISNTCPMCRREFYIAEDPLANDEEEEAQDEDRMIIDDYAIRLCVQDFRTMTLDFDDLVEDDIREALWHLYNFGPPEESSRDMYQTPLAASRNFLVLFAVGAILIERLRPNAERHEWEVVANSMQSTLSRMDGEWCTGAQLRERLLEDVQARFANGLDSVGFGFEQDVDAVLSQIVHAFWHGRRWFES